MRKRSSKKKQGEQEQPPVPQEPIQEVSPVEAPPAGKNPAAVALGKLGGAKGGPARAKKLTKEERSEIARKAAQARWRKKRS